MTFCKNFRSFGIIKWWLLITFFMSGMTPCFTQSSKLKLPLLWTVELNTLLESAPTVADINNDSRDEILVAGREEIFALGKDGRELWRWRTRGRFMTYPAVLKRKGQLSLIYLADFSGLFTCLNGAGRKIWQVELNAPSDWSATVIADLDADGVSEVIQTDEKGTVWLFNALTGAVQWQTKINGKPVSPAVGDLDGDGKQEILVATNEGFLFAISWDGSKLWQYEIGGFSETWSTSAPVIFAASDGRRYVAVASSSGKLFCLDQNGEVVWQQITRGPVASAISVGDLDQNGQADIFLTTQLGVIYRFDETGSVVWDIDMQGRSLAPGAIIDINNDGKLDYVLCTQRGHLLVFNVYGEIIFDYQFNNRTINVTPTFGEVTGSSKKLEMILTGGESGKTFCFATPALKKSLTHWPAYRSNEKNRGSWFGLLQSKTIRMFPQNLVWDQMLTGNNIHFQIYNPDAQTAPLTATVTINYPDGKKRLVTSPVIGNHSELLLPIDLVFPGSYHFQWSLTNSDRKELVSGKRDISLSPFANDRALVTSAIKTLNSTARKVERILPLSTQALKQKAQQLELAEREIQPLQNSVPGAVVSLLQSTIQKTAELNSQAERALQISQIVKQAAESGKSASLIVFKGKKWDNRNVDQQLPHSVFNPLELNYTVVEQEHQAVPLLLFNITDRMLNVRVQIDSVATGMIVTALRSINTPSSLGEESWDALPELDQSSVLEIPSLSSRELWLDIDVGTAKQGKQTIKIRLQALNGSGVVNAPHNPHPVMAPETAVEIHFQILPFQMVPAGDFRLCTWSPNQGPEVEDLLAHGNNVFLAAHGKPNYNKDGEIVQVDYSNLDNVIKHFERHDVMLLLNGFPDIKNKFASLEYEKKLTAYLNDLTHHLLRMNVDKDHFALYPIDEPGGHGWQAVNKLVKFGEMVHSVDPNIMMYVDGGQEVTMGQALAKVIDIWCPPIDWLAEDIPEMNVMRNSGKFMWSYNCSYSSARPIGPNLKNINIIYEYRTAALFAFRFHASGIGYWCYNAGRENPWARIKLEYNLVYPGLTKPITSRRWEAVREGIEDYRILSALQACLNENQLNEKARLQINHLINDSLPDLVDPSFQAVKLGLARTVIDANSNETKMNAFRKEMMECVALVSALK